MFHPSQDITHAGHDTASLTVEVVSIREDDLADGEAVLPHVLDEEGLTQVIDHVALAKSPALPRPHQLLPESDRREREGRRK